MIIHLADGQKILSSTFARRRRWRRARRYVFSMRGASPSATKSVNGYLAAGVPGTVLGLENRAFENMAPCRDRP